MAEPQRSTPPLSRNASIAAVAGVAVVLIAIVVGAIALRGSSKKHATAPVAHKRAALADGSLVPAKIVKQVTTVPAATLAAVNKGQASGLAQVSGGADIRADGKPLVFYLGAEFCPFCAAERWAVVNALGRFGTFSRLRITYSSSSDVYPSTPTLSFYGARFTSKYLTFQGVEYESNVPSGNAYTPLQQPTSAQNNLVQRFDVKPYAPDNGSIPFILVGGHFVLAGAQYQPDALQGLTHGQIAKALSDPTSSVAKGVIGAANQLTADICQITGGQPTDVCRSPALRGLGS